MIRCEQLPGDLTVDGTTSDPNKNYCLIITHNFWSVIHQSDRLNAIGEGWGEPDEPLYACWAEAQDWLCASINLTEPT